MRYQAKWSNGYWKTFDRVLFTDIDVHMTEKEAVASVKRANKGCTPGA